jgi:hypothetical protein
MPREGEHGSLCPRDLRHDVGGCSKALEPQRLTVPAIARERQSIRPAQNNGASATSPPTSPKGNAKRVSATAAVVNPPSRV